VVNGRVGGPPKKRVIGQVCPKRGSPVLAKRRNPSQVQHALFENGQQRGGVELVAKHGETTNGDTKVTNFSNLGQIGK